MHYKQPVLQTYLVLDTNLKNHTEIIISKCIIAILYSFETFTCRIFRRINT